jgi:hypothetical protein
MMDLMEGTSVLFNGYVRDSLRFRSDLFYRGPFGKAFHPEPLLFTSEGYGCDWMANMFNNGQWDPDGSCQAGRSPAPSATSSGARGGSTAAQDVPPLRRAMEANPRLRVMNLKGMYDGSCAGMEEAVSRSEPHLRNRIVSYCYEGGHMFYSDKLARQQSQRHFADFVRAAVADQPSPAAR